MEKIGEELYEEASLPQNVKIALSELDQILGDSEGIVKELGRANIEIKNLQKELSKCKNVKNHRLVGVNNAMNEKRNKIRVKISLLKDRIEELKLQREGKTG